VVGGVTTFKVPLAQERLLGGGEREWIQTSFNDAHWIDMMSIKLDYHMSGPWRPRLPTTTIPADLLWGRSAKRATGASTKSKQSKLILRSENVVTGTWTVRTCFVYRKLKEFTHELTRYTCGHYAIGRSKMDRCWRSEYWRGP